MDSEKRAVQFVLALAASMLLMALGSEIGLFLFLGLVVWAFTR